MLAMSSVTLFSRDATQPNEMRVPEVGSPFYQIAQSGPISAIVPLPRDVFAFVTRSHALGATVIASVPIPLILSIDPTI
jgi:hypothetical protein